MPDPVQPEQVWEEMEVAFVRPESYVVSIRLNADESKQLTEEARVAGQKLGTFIKSAALETIARRRVTRAAAVLLGSGGSNISIKAVVGTQFGHSQETTNVGHAVETKLPGDWQPSRDVA